MTLIVVSGAPGTGKSTIARGLGAGLRLCVLSLDPIKEALADGAVPADVAQGSVSWTVLADPEGNEFCLLSPL